jgi:hypothetical protein
MKTEVLGFLLGKISLEPLVGDTIGPHPIPQMITVENNVSAHDQVNERNGDFSPIEFLYPVGQFNFAQSE